MPLFIKRKCEFPNKEERVKNFRRRQTKRSKFPHMMISCGRRKFKRGCLPVDSILITFYMRSLIIHKQKSYSQLNYRKYVYLTLYSHISKSKENSQAFLKGEKRRVCSQCDINNGIKEFLSHR